MVPNSLRAAVIAAALASTACSGSIAAGAATQAPAAAAAESTQAIAPAPGRFAGGLPDFASLAEHYGPAVVNVAVVGKRQQVSDTPQETAIVCELLLRGPQTPGELRGRASRMAAIAEVSEVEAALNRLAAREDGPFVVRLAREPGKRESRYAHLLSGSVEGAAVGIEEYAASEAPSSAPRADRKSLEDRIVALEQKIELLEREIEGLKKG